MYLHKFLKLTFAALAVFSLNFGSAGKGPWGVEAEVE